MRITIELPETGLEEDILRKGEWEDDSLFGRSIRNALMNFTKESLEQEHILDKIRTEIDKLDVLRFSSGERIYKDEVLDIIDKYKIESESKE